MRIVHELDEQPWREFVSQHPYGNIFHTPEMFAAFQRTRGYKPALWATVGNDNLPLALMMPVQVTLRNGLLRQFTTRAIAYGSLLGPPASMGQEALAQLLQTYNQTVKASILFTELRNLSDLSVSQPVLETSGFVYEDHLNFLIDLTQTSEQLWKNIRSNAQRNIRKANKSGVVVDEAQTLEDVRAAYLILKDVYERIRVPLPHLSLFESTFEILHPKEMMHILFAKLNGIKIAALTLLVYKGTILYWYTGPLRKYSEYRPGDFLVWNALEFGKSCGCHTFDFGGGGKPDEEYGVRDFKLKFGGKQVNYGRNVCVHAPLKLKLSTLGYQLLRGAIS